jgi:vacuolar protein sorting-associated protein 54
LDTVEIHLISSISTASQSFFAALGSLKELHSEAAESVAKIQKLREDLMQLDKEMAIGGLEIVKMKQRRENLRKLSEAIFQLQCIVDGATHCEELVTNGELEKAIDRIQTLENFTCGHMDSEAARDISWLCPELPRQLLDMRELNALDGFAEGMDQLRYRIGKGYESRFIEALLADLRHYVENVQVDDTLRRWARKSSTNPPAYLQTNTVLRKDLSATIQGLSRAKYLTTATKTFRDQIVKEIKSIIRQHLPSSSDDDADSTISSSTRSSRTPASRQEKSAILARNLRALPAEDAEELFTKIYCRVGEALRRLQVQVRLLLDISSGQATISPKSPPKSPMLNTIEATIAKTEASSLQTEIIQTLDLSSLLGQAVDTAHTQITRVLKVRSEEVTQTSPPQFLRYFTLNRLFADECEVVSGRSGAGLRGVVDIQIKEFISVMVEKERQHLAQTMEEDKWDTWDFTERDDTILSEVLQAMQTDPAPWLAQTHVWEPQQMQPSEVVTTNQPSKPSETNGTGKDKEKIRPAFIDSEKYNLVKSSILLLHGLARFEGVICCIPRMTDTLSTAILDYLRLFNSRCNQLVLFAGATRSAGLANINTKHLALASQALGFIVALVPYLREFVRRKIPGGTGGGGRDRMAGFDAVMRETQRNQMGIHDKLVDIMSARATAHVNTMRKIDFDEQGEDSGKSSPHMETLTKETGLLHRVLSRHLPEVSVRMVMGPVFVNYREQWGKAFGEVKVKTEVGKQRYVIHVPFYSSVLVPLSRLDSDWS